ncbi:MAG: tRNA pseudouridine(38-40) synthase TruA [Candidatus Binatia bacterium]
MRFKLIVEYDGTNYHGWQVQPRKRTVQAVLEDAVGRMLGEKVRVTAAGRTDAGVHAGGQVASVSVQRDVSADKLRAGLNALTPADVSVRKVDVVAEDFDPRRAARSRVYTYRIWNVRVPSPFWRRYAWHVARPLDCPRMRVAAACLLGEHDFSAFQAAGGAVAHPVRRVLRSELDQNDQLITYTVEATGFLRHMVRNIVGTLVEVGTADRPSNDLSRVLEARDRALAGRTAPARGLCLTQVNF